MPNSYWPAPFTGQNLPGPVLSSPTADGLEDAQGKRIELQSYESCKYQLNAAAIAGFSAAATSAADWDGAVAGAAWTADVAAGVRLVNQSTGVIYTLTTATTCTATGDPAQYGALLSVPGSAGAPTYRQTAASGTPAFVSVDAIALAAAKAYTDLIAQGLDPKPSVVALSTINVATLSGLATTVDTVALNTDGMRVGLGGQTTLKDRGIYAVHAGAWTRVADMATGSDADGNYFTVERGTHKGEGWIFTSPTSGTCIVGTDDLSCTKFGGYIVGTTSGTIAAGDDSRIVGALPAAGGAMTGPIAMGGNSITNFANESGAAVNLNSPGGMTALLVSTFIDEKARGYLTASHKYFAVMSARIFLWKTANPDTVVGWIDLPPIGMRISTDGSNVATVAFNRTASDIAYMWECYNGLMGDALPLAAAGLLPLLAASTGGFTISLTEATGVACTAKCVGRWINHPELLV